ncbi:MAG: hypothetical protein AUI36_41225 [Cyanobacteria bacterium 13_1_40CM_2_61_4]|nr:MAG: hypothetical protein AUI36_41225 [Cyanobacteria bacterium 13_1_40CM_2_61_4]
MPSAASTTLRDERQREIVRKVRQQFLKRLETAGRGSHANNTEISFALRSHLRGGRVSVSVRAALGARWRVRVLWRSHPFFGRARMLPGDLLARCAVVWCSLHRECRGSLVEFTDHTGATRCAAKQSSQCIHDSMASPGTSNTDITNTDINSVSPGSTCVFPR